MSSTWIQDRRYSSPPLTTWGGTSGPGWSGPPGGLPDHWGHGAGAGRLGGDSHGLVAGFRGGWFDRICMRVVDAYLSFPYILIAIVWAALIGADIRNLIIIMAVRS
jgi:hypothetical protein